MDRVEYQQQQHQHRFLMPPPAMQQQQELCMPLMDEPFLMGGRRGGGAAGSSEMRKRRFTEEQIRSLESTFHAHQAKLEPREKAELARELGLQPRQVAIWFQNKRARWRSKQLEHDFAALRAKYDALHSRVESLKQEKLALTTQLHELSERLREQGGAATASSSSCNGGSEELADVEDKRNVAGGGCGVDVEPPESCVLGGTTACVSPADVSVDSECGDHVAYSGGFPESFCATPELWEPWPWPPVEWNAVA